MRGGPSTAAAPDGVPAAVVLLSRRPELAGIGAARGTGIGLIAVPLAVASGATDQSRLDHARQPIAEADWTSGGPFWVGRDRPYQPSRREVRTEPGCTERSGGRWGAPLAAPPYPHDAVRSCPRSAPGMKARTASDSGLPADVAVGRRPDVPLGVLVQQQALATKAAGSGPHGKDVGLVVRVAL